MCRRRMRKPKVADSTGAELTGAGLLTRTLLLRRLLGRVLDEDEKNVGLLLPPSVAAVVVNAALALDRRVAINLNYTASSQIVNDCIAQCGIRRVLASRRLMERCELNLHAKIVYVDDFRNQITLLDKLVAAAAAWLAPVWWLERRLRLSEVRADDLLTIIFTSGSTGRPKGVMLTQRNIGSNVEAVNQFIRLSPDDVLTGVLPIFHSFGYTTTMWTVLTLLPRGVYHYNPLEAQEVGKLCRRHGATIMIATPTFLRAYVRRCQPEDFAKLDVVYVGAEKLSVELADAFERRFSVRPVEGYGATELSPVVSGNVPPSRALSKQHEGIKEGTVGRPLPGVSAKVVDLETGEDLGRDRSGMLLVSGPNVMKGYYGQPDLTAQSMRDGWYVTGDVASIDADGFIKITGRVSRFSKIGGEMVPHIRLEEAIVNVPEIRCGRLKIAVTAVPDLKRGERLVVLYTELPQDPQQICRALAAAGLPALWIPSPDSFRRVQAIPLLGTGKLDLKRLKDLAMAEFGSQ